MRKFAIGNWKMNGNIASLKMLGEVQAAQALSGVSVVICPPYPLLHAATLASNGSGVEIGAQSCHHLANGAHTGDVSSDLLADVGARYVIIGHSERRADHHESNSAVCAQFQSAKTAGLTPILCIGETQAERAAGRTIEVISSQLKASLPPQAQAFILAYEPIWAIGTGLIPSLDEIAQVHAFLAHQLAEICGSDSKISVLYGGSVKASNAAQIFALPHVDGALVGGASLAAKDFCPIVTALGHVQ